MTKPRVLVVEDQQEVRDLIKIYLEDDYEVEMAVDGEEGLKKFKDQHPGLIILDIMLPKINGWEVCKTIRQESNIPIIMLTAKGEEVDRVLGLDLGADDYVTKPFSPRELLARVRAILRRTIPHPTENAKELYFPKLWLSFTSFQVKAGEHLIPLTAKEFELFWQLASNPGRVFTREQLLEMVWGYDYYGDVRNVDAHIKRIRRKMEVELGVADYLTTVWGVGYKFEVLQ